MNSFPETWELTTLEHYGEIVSGGTPDRNNPAYWNGDVLWVTPSEITSNNGKYLQDTREKITKIGLNAISAKLLPKNSLLVTSRATLGEVAVAAKPVSTNQGFKSIVPNSKTDPNFAYHQVKTIKREMVRLASGTTFLEISKGDFSQIVVHRPQLPEQSRIAYVLDTIDQAIAQTEAVIAKLKQVRAGMLHDLLSYGLDEHGQLRDPVAHPEQFKDSPLGLIPREWDVLRLVDRAGVFGGKRLPSGHSYANPPTGCRYLRVLDFFEKSIAYDELAILRKETFAALSRYEIHDGELFISIAGSLGFVGVLRPKTTERYILTENAARISILRDLIPEFLSLYMNGVAVQKQINAEKGIGAGVPKLALHRIERLWVAQPKPEEQESIVSITAQFDHQLGTELIELRKLETLRSGLQDDLLSGRVRVPETIMEGAENG